MLTLFISTRLIIQDNIVILTTYWRMLPNGKSLKFLALRKKWIEAI